MNIRRNFSLLALLLSLLLLAGCTALPEQESETEQRLSVQDEHQRLREELRKSEAEQQRLKQALADLQRQLRDEQRKAEEVQQKQQAQLAERQRLLREEQRKVEELEGKVAELEKKVAALRRIDRETLQRAIRK
jgi:colicin import membrane protein